MSGTDTEDTSVVPFDPFELKDVVGGSIRDPYPQLHELRRASPVHTGPIDLGEGAEIGEPDKPPPVTVFGFDEVVQVLRDNETYSSAVYADVVGMVMGRTILQMDEPEHRGIRALVAPSFRSKVLERWEEDREIAGLRAREERRRAEAAALAEKYAVDRLALRLLLEAQRHFEQEQQPRILKLASRAFQELTGGRYVRVHASATQPGSLLVDQADGAEWRDEQLSRGTREQLYLAFRLAVIEDFGETRLPLPILLDDVLVNFDRQRARNVVKVFARLSARHQVIAFTCHEPVRDLFAEHGARVIEVAGDRLGLLAVSA